MALLAAEEEEEEEEPAVALVDEGGWERLGGMSLDVVGWGEMTGGCRGVFWGGVRCGGVNGFDDEDRVCFLEPLWR